MRAIEPTDAPRTVASPQSLSAPSSQIGLRFPVLDGLRGFAAVGIAIFHYLLGPAQKLPFLDRGLRLSELSPLSLDTFFILSGFLIGGILLQIRNAPGYYKAFYSRRSLRILPLYFSWMALFFVLYFLAPGWGLSRPQQYSTGFYLASYLLFFQNFSPAIVVSAQMMVPAWTLVVEEYFYLLIPVCVRRLSSRRLVQLLLAVIVLAPLFRAVLFRYLTHRHGWAELSVYFWPPCRADALAMGVILAVAWRDADLRKWLHDHVSPVRWGMFAFSSAAYFLAWMAEHNFHHCRSLNAGLGRTAVELACLCLIIYLLTSPLSGVSKVFCSNVGRELGKISYCLYIVHWGVLWMIFRFVLHARFGERLWLDFTVIPIALLISIGIAELSWKYVESPLLRRARRNPQPVAIPAISEREPQVA